MLERISRIIKSKNISASQFADHIGVQRSNVSHVLSGRNKPSLDFVTRIINAYHDIDPNWLLTGAGQMYRTEDISLDRIGDENTRVVKDKEQLSIDMGGREEIRPVHGQKRSSNSKTVAGSFGVERIIIFYDNGTYEEFVSVKNT